ncbi:MAG: ribose 5-phosphate isomerase B [Deltaproteobacteria bacterium]|nr:ribose 5-phosphate isomerase B [Deltaproteobacteria bacterium]
MTQKIAIGSDHAGFQLKEILKSYLQSEGHEVLDFGCPSEESCDYPDYAAKVAHAVAEGKAERGVLVCGTGIGMCMTANKIKGIRAAVLRTFDDARLSREHNDANIACLGGRITAVHQAQSLLDTFLKTPFQGGRHAARVQKIEIHAKS